MTDQDQVVGREWSEGFSTEIDELERALEAALSGDRSRQAFDSLVQRLETAGEELRVADEELRTQNEELRHLVVDQQTRRWQRERMLSVLPSPVILTNGQGAVRSANAAAASLLQMRVDLLLRRPLQSFVAVVDRRELRQDLARALAEDSQFRRVVTLLPRDGEAVRVEISATVDRDPLSQETEVTWLLLVASQPSPQTVATQQWAAVVRAMSDLTRLPLLSEGAANVLTTAADICQRALGESVAVSISVGEPTAPRDVGTTSKLAQRVDGAQVQAGEGPCERAWRQRETVITQDLHTDPRWESLGRLVNTLPVQGTMAVPIAVGEDVLGALNVYAEGFAFSDDQVTFAELLASAVAAIFFELEVKAELESTARNLRVALTSRAVIDQAKGIIMATAGCDADEAFRRLVKISSVRNLKLREVAAALVLRTAEKAPGSGAGQ